ncbi:DUF3833 domain-containing protein [Photobacterium ganghwense]|uniref:DUF3833 domain-containing protein n=1 Tax=Photobacterium ganghwense TaxID=320778 RepID=UPI0040577894
MKGCQRHYGLSPFYSLFQPFRRCRVSTRKSVPGWFTQGHISFRLLLIGFCALLSGCSASVGDYLGTKPTFDLFRYFDGQVQAWGMVQDRSGKQIRRFEVMITGTVQGHQLTLNENFVFNDGEKQQRIWRITRHKDGSYTGTADDVVGTAKGQVAGNALNWRYVLRVPVGDSTYDIQFDDWMYLQDKQHMFNVAEMSKWGWKVGQVTLFFKKLDSDKANVQ